MRKIPFFLLFSVLASVSAFAHTSGEPKGRGYVFFAPGTGSAGKGLMHFGGGGEGLLYQGLGVGAEFGYLAPWGSFGDGIGTFSSNVSYHFLRRNPESKAEPFLTGGYTLFFRSGTANGFNLGGGVNYWISKRAALRLEFRDHVGLWGSEGRHICWVSASG